MVYNGWTFTDFEVRESESSKHFLSFLNNEQLIKLGCSDIIITYLANIRRIVDPRNTTVPARVARKYELSFGANLREVNAVVAIDSVRAWLNSIANVGEYTVSDEERRDFQLKYASTYGIHSGSVVYISDIDRQGRIISYNVNNGRIENQQILKKEEIEFVIPKLGYVNLPQYSVLVERESIRRGDKYKKAFHYDSFKVNNISREEIINTKIEFITDTDNKPREIIANHIVKHIFFKEYPTYQQALEDVLSFKTLSRAFSSTLCIKLDKGYNKFVLLKNKWVIATYNTKNNKWSILNNSFNEELDKYSIEYEVLA